MRRNTQKALAREMGFGSTAEIRDLVHSMRSKGWGVLSDSNGMYRTESQTLKDNQAVNLLTRAASIMSAAEGLVKKEEEKEELDIHEQMLWLLLPERKEEIELFKTSFEPITEEELR